MAWCPSLSGICRRELSGFVMRVEDFVAPKLEKMFFESLRGLGDAGECGMSWYDAMWVAASGSLPLIASGDDGLKGLIGEFKLSFPPFGSMASDSEDDFGILRSGFRGVSQGW